MPPDRLPRIFDRFYAGTDQATLVRRLDGVSRVWLVETGGGNVPVALANSGLRLAARYPAGDIMVAGARCSATSRAERTCRSTPRPHAPPT